MGGRGSSSGAHGGGSAAVKRRYAEYSTGSYSDSDTITSKQAGLLYRGYKSGSLNASQSQMNLVYQRFVGSYHSSTDSTMKNAASRLRTVVTAAAKGDWAVANHALNKFLDAYHGSFTDPMFPDDRKRKR